MQTALECIPCFARQAYNAARAYAPDDRDRQSDLLREALQAIAAADYNQSPPAIAQALHRHLRETTGLADPYAPEKHVATERVLALLPELEAKLAGSDRPFALAVQLAIAGNVIDFGAPGWHDGMDLRAELDRAMAADLCPDALAAFQAQARAARSILYLGDNCGEGVLDRLLIQQLGPEKTTYAVRDRPVLNDLTWDDAKRSGLTDLCRTISNGSDAPGTILADCSAEFRREFEAADLVVAKGQGNYETLSDVPREIFFLLKVKCPVVASLTGQAIGATVLYRKPGR